jgi:hypothetical protein
MATQSAIHHMLAILAGDPVPAAPAALAQLITRLGWGGLARDPLTAETSDAGPWFVRVTFPGIAPTDPFIIQVATAAGLRVESLAEESTAPSRWLLVGPQSSSEVSSAVAHLRATHRIHAVPFRQTEGR